MTQEVSQKPKSTDGSGQNAVHSGNHVCPRCGGEVVATSQGVTASFPSPALESRICSDSECNYVKYVKLGSNGFATEGSAATDKGVQSA